MEDDNLFQPVMLNSVTSTFANPGGVSLIPELGGGIRDNFGTTKVVLNPDNDLFGMSSGQLSGLGSIAGGVAGLASAFSQMPVLRAQRRGLEQNIKFAKQDQENRYKNMRSFNSFGQNA